MTFQTTGRTRVRSIKCCVLFDPADGTIRHTHRIVTMEGADETPEPMIEERTRLLAREFGIEVDRLQLLHVDSQGIESNKHYKVDPRNRRLVAVDRVSDKEKRPGFRERP